MRFNKRITDYEERPFGPKKFKPLPKDVDLKREVILRVQWTWWAVEAKGDIPWPCIYRRDEVSHTYDLIPLGLDRPFSPEFVGFLYTDALRWSFGQNYSSAVQVRLDGLPSSLRTANGSGASSTSSDILRR